MAEQQSSTTHTAQKKDRGLSDQDSSSETSSGVDLHERLRKERSSRKERDEVYQRLQDDYDELLKKFAQAENTIDHLRIGAKLNLYSDLPPPQQSSFVHGTAHKQPSTFRFPRSSQAVLSEGSLITSQRLSHSVGTGTQNGSPRTSTSNTGFDPSTPDVVRLRAALSSKVQYFQEDVDALQNHVMEGQWGEPELQELRDMCEQLKAQNENFKRELHQIQRLESGRDPNSFEEESFSGEFLPDDSLNGQLYRCGLRLEEISDQIGYVMSSRRVPNQEARRNSYTELLNRPRDGHPQLVREDQRAEPDLQNLMQRLKHIKEASMNDIPREGYSSEEAEDFDLNSDEGDLYARRFSLGPLPDSEGDLDNKEGLGEHAEPLDLQESGYFASESMSVIQDPLSEPLASQYFANSQGAHDGSRRGSLSVTSPRRLSVTSTVGQRSRSNSHRSGATTVDLDSPPPPEDDGDNDLLSSSLPSPETSPGNAKSPRASSSPLRHDVTGSPSAPRYQDSRSSEVKSKPSRTNAKATRPPRSVSDHDSLRDAEIAGVPDETFLPRDRAPSNRSLPRDSHVSKNARNRSNSYDPSRDLNGLYDGDSVPKPSRVSHGRPLRASVSGDSRVSTPLFLPDGSARPRDSHRGGKRRNPTVESERGFDSGFFGSEGSRISRGNESPDIPLTFNRENKLRNATLLEQSATETEDDRLRSTMPKIMPKLVPRSRDLRRRRSSLQSLSESEEDRALEMTHAKPQIRTPSSQRDRKSHRHTQTQPTPRSENEDTRRLDDTSRRNASTPSLNDDGVGDRSGQSRVADRGSRTPRHEGPANAPKNTDQRPMDKQSVRSYPGDRDSLRSGRRSRRGEDSSSGYSDNERRYRRDPADKLRDELQNLRAQLQQDANARGMQTQMYEDLRGRHDDLQREMARRGTEQQMANMYDNLQKKYDALANEMSRSRENEKSTSWIDDLRHRIEGLSRDIGELKQRENDRPPVPSPVPAPVPVPAPPPPSPAPQVSVPPPSATQTPDVFLMHFLCPFCGDAGSHSHGSYFYPGYSGTVQGSPEATTGTSSPRRRLRNTETQTSYIPQVTTTFVRHPSTPVAASTPYAPYYHNVVSPPVHHHTHTYPGVATASPVLPTATMVTPGVPVVNSGGLIDTSTVHHIHHIPGRKSKSRRDRDISDSEESDSDEGYPAPRRHTRVRSNTGNRSNWGGSQGDELESYRLHQSLDVANRAARKMQQLSKRMLSNITTDLIRSGNR